MKRYILGILLCMGFDTIFSKLSKQQIKFHKSFLKWEQKNITLPVHKEFMKDFISEYKKYYKFVDTSNEDLDTKILASHQAALKNIMDNWESFYKRHIVFKSFYDSVKNKYKDSKKFQSYFKAYEKYDKNPSISKLRMNVEKEQKKVESLIK